MPRYRVFQVQDERRSLTTQYDVEAADQAEALELAQSGNIEATSDESTGTGFGESGWAARLVEDNETEEAAGWRDAFTVTEAEEAVG